jgi:transcriptional regulator with XRE-family HTH domain
MINVAIEARVRRASEICRERGITQAQIATAVGASQSQVSRILSGRGQRPSRLLEEVCLFVERHVGGVTVDAVRENEVLVGAIKDTWDGSAAHAIALSTVIRSLVVLRQPGDAPKTKPTGGDR